MRALDHLPRIEPEVFFAGNRPRDEAEHRVAYLEHAADRIEAGRIANSSVVGPAIVKEQPTNFITNAQLQHAGDRAVDDHFDQLAERKFRERSVELHKSHSSDLPPRIVPQVRLMGNRHPVLDDNSVKYHNS